MSNTFKDIHFCIVLKHVSALEALRNALYKFSTYLLIYITKGCIVHDCNYGTCLTDFAFEIFGAFTRETRVSRGVAAAAMLARIIGARVGCNDCTRIRIIHGVTKNSATKTSEK